MNVSAFLRRLGCAVITVVALCGSLTAAETDIVGYWNQPALGTVLGPGIAAVFGFEEDSTEARGWTRSGRLSRHSCSMKRRAPEL